MNFAVTTVNSNAQEGNYSASVSAGDNVPPACADQGDAFDNNMAAPVDGSAVSNLPIYDLLSCYPVAVPGPVGTCSLATSPDINLETLDEEGGIPADNEYNAADWTSFGGVSNSVMLTMNEDLDSGQTLPACTLDTLGTATCDGLALFGTGSSIRTVIASITGVSLILPGDTLSMAGILDEAGNVGGAAAAVVFGDEMNPLITAGTTSDNGTDEDQIILDVTEPLDDTTGEAIANYTSDATLVGATASLNTTADQVTIEAPADGAFADVILGYDCPAPGLSIASNNLISMPGVEDLNGNLGVATGVLDFQLADGISPRILSAATAAGAINTGAPGVNGLWDVGDGAAAENISLQASFSEPVIWDTDCDGDLDQVDAATLGITAVLTAVNPTTYFGLVASVGSFATALDLQFDFQINGTALVAQGDVLRVLGVDDTSGNSLNTTFDEIELNAATTGYTIN
jgi:hypothetical protein